MKILGYLETFYLILLAQIKISISTLFLNLAYQLNLNNSLYQILFLSRNSTGFCPNVVHKTVVRFSLQALHNSEQK